MQEEQWGDRRRTVVLEDLALSRVYVPETDVDETVGLEDRGEPCELGDGLLRRSGQSHEERDRAAVEVA